MNPNAVPMEQRRFRDRLPEYYTHQDVNPYMERHRDYGPPILSASAGAERRGQWELEFGRQAPLHVEIGPGNGFFLTGMADRHRDWNWVGVEIRFKRLFLTGTKIEKAGLVPSVRIVRYDAEFLDELFVDGELSGLYINHPDPWPRERHAKHRLLCGDFLDLAARLLADGAEMRLKTDYLPNLEAVLDNLEGRPFAILGKSMDIARDGAPWEDDVVTNYQRKFNEKGLPVYGLRLRRIPRAPQP